LGGAIFNEGGSVTLLASTVASNTVVAGAAGIGYGGSADGTPGVAEAGGIYNHAAGSLTLRNTMLANSSGGQDCYNNGGSVTAPFGDRNLIEAHTGCGTPAVTDDPQLAPLDGGSPPLHPLPFGSPAVNAGLCLAEAPTDQRGVARPQGAACDIGAYEYPYPALALSKTAAPENNVPYHGTVTCTLILSNTGLGDASGVVLTDTLPAGVTFARWVERPAGAAESGGTLAWNGALAASSALTFTFVVTHTGGYGDVITNTAEYGHSSGSGAAQATFTVAGPPEVRLTPAALDFGDQLVGTSSATQTVTLQNSGGSPLEVVGIVISGDFMQAHACPASLPPGASCAIGVTFAPAVTGTRSGVLTVTTNAAGSPHTVALSGVGVAPLLTIQKIALPAANVAYHGVVSYVIQLENNGSVDATDVHITDTLPISVTFLDWLPAPPPGAARDGNLITWQGTVPAGGSAGLAFRARHIGGYGETVTNTVEYHHLTGSGAAAATFTVVPNTPPVIAEGDALTLTLFEDGGPLTTTLHAIDTDPLRWDLGAPPLHGTAIVSGTGPAQVITYTPAVNDDGRDSFVVRVADDYGGMDAITVTVLITPVNDAPVLAPIGPQAVDEGALLTFTVSASDPDGDPLTFSAAPLPPGALLAGGVFSWTPGFDAAGVYTVTVAASDGALTDTADVTITVRDVPLAPRILYLPLVVRNHPRSPLLLGPFPAIPNQPVVTPGAPFYTTVLSLSGTLPESGRFYFSGAPNRITPVVVDDRLALVRGGQDIFVYTFSTANRPPAAAVVEIPRSAMEAIAAGGVTLEYRDVFGVLIGADEMWLIWVE